MVYIFTESEMFDLSMTSQNVVPPPQYCSRTELYDSVAYDILCNLVIFGLLAGGIYVNLVSVKQR